MSTSTMNRTTSLSRTGKTDTLSSVAPWLSRLVMFPPVVVFSLIGTRFFANPGHAVPGVTLQTPEAFTDTRVLGAWMVTFLVMLITFLMSEKRLWLGHLQIATIMGVTLAVRIFGFMHDGTTLAMGNQRMITIAETILLILNTVGLLVQTRLLRPSEVSS